MEEGDNTFMSKSLLPLDICRSSEFGAVLFSGAEETLFGTFLYPEEMNKDVAFSM